MTEQNQLDGTGKLEFTEDTGLEHAFGICKVRAVYQKAKYDSLLLNPDVAGYNTWQRWTRTKRWATLVLILLAVGLALWKLTYLEAYALATAHNMWYSGLISLLIFGASSVAQQAHWGPWHPGPSHGWNNNSANVIDLTGSSWTLTSENGSINVPARVPSQQYIDLYNAGIIPDPLFGENNTQVNWVRDQNWTYARILRELKTTSQEDWTSTLLVFDGLDTFTTITLCGKEVAYTENSFRQYIFDISNTLKSCTSNPQLVLNFGSAVDIAHGLSKGPYKDDHVNFGTHCSDEIGHELSCKAYARKEQNDFGWDWSPALVPAGPWKPIYAVQLASDSVYISNALFDIYRKGQVNNLPPDQSQPWIFNASIDFIGNIPHNSSLRLTLVDASGEQILQQDLGGVYASNGTITGSTTIDPKSVGLWWPNGLGAQILYNATVDIVKSGSQSDGDIAASVVRRVGFRTIVLNLKEISDNQIAAGIAPGTNWHFEINGHEFYAMGSNLVPPDVFWPRVDEAKITQLFTLAKDANMNMLRVWSSGAYLDDWIYDIADEMGLLLWSEFQFSDAPYPANDHYFAEYEAEAYYNVRRVNHHPSLALWAGGNELEQVMLAYFFGGEIFYEYQTIFEELLLKCVWANTNSISYIPSSTYNGYLSLEFDTKHPMTSRYKNTSGEGYYYSDTDAYNYDASTLFDLDSYPTGRFAAEFGFISLPSLQSWEQQARPEDLFYPSDTIVNHNRHVQFNSDASKSSRAGLQVTDDSRDQSLAGIADMTKAIEMYLPSPNLQDSRANFSAWCYSTQIVQAEAMEHQIAFYRRGSGMPERNLGSLYWMLNDVWNAPTWAGIEANGRQKILHYAVKDIFSPVIVYGYWDESADDLSVWVTSDLWKSISGTVSYQWVDFSGKSLSLQDNDPGNKISFTVGAINTTQVLHYTNLTATFSASQLSSANALLFLSVEAGSYNHSSVFHPTNLRDIDLPDPGLELSRNRTSFTITATKAVAAWVWLDYDTNDVLGYWSDNGFWLNKGESKTVTFTVFTDETNGEWVKSVSVRSVWDNERE